MSYWRCFFQSLRLLKTRFVRISAAKRRAVKASLRAERCFSRFYRALFLLDGIGHGTLEGFCKAKL